KWVSYPVVENYVKNTWSKYELDKSMLYNELFFFKFSSIDGMDEMLENGPCEDGLSIIATKIGTLMMIDSYTSGMCMQSWGRWNGYLRKGRKTKPKQQNRTRNGKAW
ncbi:hypothetical protein Tco_0833694, partial [Tanacetum coccineum]